MALSPRGSKQKGSRFELELAAYLNSNIEGLKARRALLSGGGRNEGGADLDGTPHVHVEAKRTEKMSPKAAIRQAEDAISKAEERRMPVVINRGNHEATEDSLVVMRLKDWLRMYRALLAR